MMTSLQRCLAAIQWQIPDRVPVVPQNSDMAIHLSGYGMIECSKYGRKLALAMLECQKKFGYDGHIMGPDAAILAEALGCETAYRDGDPPAITTHVLQNLKDIHKLKIINPYKDGRLPQWLKALELLNQKVGDKQLIIARADQGAFSLACLLRGIENLLVDIMLNEEPELINTLLTFCNNCHIEFAKAISQTGAHVVTCGDSYGGPAIIGADNYQALALPFEKIATHTIQETFGLPYSIHICGKTDEIIDSWIKTKAKIFEVDHRTDIVSLRKATLNQTAILGNLDTDLLSRGEPKQVEDACKSLFQIMMPASGFLLSSGCSMLGSVKPDNLTAMVDASRKYGNY